MTLFDPALVDRCSCCGLVPPMHRAWCDYYDEDLDDMDEWVEVDDYYDERVGEATS